MKTVTKITDPTSGEYVGFTTEYSDNEYIEKTIVYGCDVSDEGDIVKHGRITVVMRNGLQYEFDCMASTVYSGQFGITVSKDGLYVYVISDEVGLWCYSYQGEIHWKTRYTSIGHIIENDDRTITCIASTKLLVIDENGNKIKERKIGHYHAEKASKNLIYAAITEKKMALIDCRSLEVLWQSDLKQLDLQSSRMAVVYDRYLIIKGEKNNGRIIFLKIELSEDVYKKNRYDETLAMKNGFDLYIKRNI